MVAGQRFFLGSNLGIVRDKIFYEFGKSRAAFLVAVDAALRKMSVLCAVEAFSMFRAFRFHRFGKDCMS
jgi:hypothetical protein